MNVLHAQRALSHFKKSERFARSAYILHKMYAERAERASVKSENVRSARRACTLFEMYAPRAQGTFFLDASQMDVYAVCAARSLCAKKNVSRVQRSFCAKCTLSLHSVHFVQSARFKRRACILCENVRCACSAFIRPEVRMNAALAQRALA